MIEKAIRGSLTNHLPAEIYAIEGMSSDKVRNLLNNICGLSQCNYLEVGAFKGSTLIASLYKNPVNKAYVIENWSQFGNARDEFLTNLGRYLSGRLNDIKIIEKDCFTSIHEIKDDIDIFFYDGPHTYEDQYKALRYFYPVLKDDFIFIVDDYNEPEVIKGTMDSINDSWAEIMFMSVLPSRFNGDKEYYWNGVAIFKLRK